MTLCKWNHDEAWWSSSLIAVKNAGLCDVEPIERGLRCSCRLCERRSVPRRLLEFLGPELPNIRATISEENEGAIKLASNPTAQMN